MLQNRRLVLSTLFVSLFLFGLSVFFHNFSLREMKVELPVSSYPSMGKKGAPVEIVLIEDFQCHQCREFSQKIIPKIQSHYVKTGKARFVLVPVSFLAGSQVLANSALEIYKQRPSEFFPFLADVLSHEGELRKEDLLRFARRIQGIDLERFYANMVRGAHNLELDKNLNWARALMGIHFRTPSLYINGKMGSTYSFEAIRDQVEQILEGK